MSKPAEGLDAEGFLQIMKLAISDAHDFDAKYNAEWIRGYEEHFAALQLRERITEREAYLTRFKEWTGGRAAFYKLMSCLLLTSKEFEKQFTESGDRLNYFRTDNEIFDKVWGEEIDNISYIVARLESTEEGKLNRFGMPREDLEELIKNIS